MTNTPSRRRWRSEKPKPKRGSQSGSPIFAVLRGLVILLFGILTIQLLRMQVIKGDEYALRAEINALREVQATAARGLIFDRDGRPLVRNVPRFSAAVIPGDLPERGEPGIYAQLEELLGVPAGEIEKKVEENVAREGPYSPAVIKTDLDRDTGLILKEMESHLAGVKLLVEPGRGYLHGALTSHFLGYVGPISAEEYAALQDDGYLVRDLIGKTGVESTYESLLRGKPSRRLVEVDAAGRELRLVSERLPVDGSNLVLTVDLDLQRQVTETLQEFAAGSDNAAALVMDVRSGDILAMVSLPGFDSNVFSGPLSDQDLAALVDSPGKPLVNHAIAEMYPPGSTFKTIVGAAALQEGVAAPGTVITSRGYITVENEFDPNVVYVFKDWAPLGALDFYGGISMSSDVYFYYLAGGKSDEGFRGLGETRLASYARAFGLGEPTGIDLPGESPGLVPDARWKEETVGESWFVGDTYNFGIGQGYLSVTPLQLATAISAIANGGELLKPHLLKEVQDSHGNVLESLDKQVRRNVPVDPGYLKVVRDAMYQSVSTGVAKPAAVAGLAIAGKTGTAEFGPPRPDGSHATHGWFAGFAPYDDPQVAIVVFVQRGGGKEAAPAAAKIFDYYFHGPKLAQNPVLSEAEGPQRGD